MVIKSIVFAGITFGLLLVISLLVAGLIQLVYVLVHRKEAEKTGDS
jgi:hypothetical protein